ncbi:MAG: hypothetical protein ACJA0X_003049 [Cyclobacteriaceae bacterium]|jgi:hypothetical protein
MKEETLTSINQVIAAYFELGTQENVIPVKELMPDFIKASIFPKDERNGLPIRNVLRALDDDNALESIPRLHAERKDKNTYWYFVREGFTYVSDAPNDTGVSKRRKIRQVESESDEHYLINLCDELLAAKASRHHCFSFILGDYHKDGRTRSELPVDAYYEIHNLVIEFLKSDEAIPFDRPSHKTISGVTRSKQRAIYTERKKNGLIAKGVNFIEIEYASFDNNEEGMLVREKEKDQNIMRDFLKNYLK